MFKWLKQWAQWRLAGAELEELHQRRLLGKIYRQWFGAHEFPEVATVLANMETEVLGRQSLDACWPPGATGPWTVDRLRAVVRDMARSKDDAMRAKYLDQLTELQQLRQDLAGGRLAHPLTVAQLAQAFEAWETGYRAEPEKYMTEAQTAALNVSTVSADRAVYFAALLRDCAGPASVANDSATTTEGGQQ